MPIDLPERPGGYVSIYQLEARLMLRSGQRIRIEGDQYSAAAIQVVWLKEHGAAICVVRGDLYFHYGTSRGLTTDPVHDVLGPVDSKRIGRLSAYWFKSFAPSFFGIRNC
jgi:hypothetical protein